MDTFLSAAMLLRYLDPKIAADRLNNAIGKAHRLDPCLRQIRAVILGQRILPTP